MSAESVAESLSKLFLSQGMYEDVSPSSTTGIRAASSQVPAYINNNARAFEGLSVRAVGFSDEDVAGDPACYIYVTRSSKKSEKMLPDELNGVKIVARKVGRMYVRPEHAAAATNLGNVYRVDGKIACGSSIAPAAENSAGTLGAFLTVEGSEEIFALSNNHVIGGCNHTPLGQPILSPSNIDAGADRPQVLQFAGFHSLLELRSGHHIHVPLQRSDAAVAKVMDVMRNQISSSQGNHYDTPSEASEPDVRMMVKKTGRTTGLTVGRVESLITTLFPLPYKQNKFAATVNFTGVWSVRSTTGSPFALPGDSGSLVVTEDGEKAVGLVFACSADGMIGFMCPLPEVLTQLAENRELRGARLLSGAH